MRILIPLLLLFSSIAADAQLRFTLDPSFRREVGFLIAKKGFAGPRTCGLPTSPNSLDAPPKGFQVYDTCANKLYAWSGSGWLQIGGSGTVTLDTTTIYLNIGSKLNKTDTASMLLPYARQSNVTAALAAKLSISDTLSMLNAYAKQAETNAALAGKVNIADTQLMLLGYVRQGTIHIFSILGIDSVGKQVGDFVRYDSLGNLSLQGFPATFELDDATNGLVVANYSGVTVVPGTLLWKAKADELYASVGSLSAKLNASDTQTMLQNYRHWLAGYLSSVNIANINATGTPGTTTYLRGDGTWATPDAGGGGGTTYTTDAILSASTALGLSMKGYNLMTSPFEVRAGSNLTDGRIEFAAVYVQEASTLTGVGWFQTVAGNFTGDNSNGIALYSYSGGTLTKVAETANDANLLKGTSNTWQKAAFTSPYSAAAGVYYVAFLYNSSAQTTAPAVGTANYSNSGASGQGTLFTNSARVAGILNSQTSFPSTVASSSLSGAGAVINSYLY